MVVLHIHLFPYMHGFCLAGTLEGLVYAIIMAGCLYEYLLCHVWKGQFVFLWYLLFMALTVSLFFFLHIFMTLEGKDSYGCPIKDWIKDCLLFSGCLTSWESLCCFPSIIGRIFWFLFFWTMKNSLIYGHSKKMNRNSFLILVFNLAEE